MLGPAVGVVEAVVGWGPGVGWGCTEDFRAENFQRRDFLAGIK